MLEALREYADAGALLLKSWSPDLCVYIRVYVYMHVLCVWNHIACVCVSTDLCGRKVHFWGCMQMCANTCVLTHIYIGYIYIYIYIYIYTHTCMHISWCSSTSKLDSRSQKYVYHLYIYKHTIHTHTNIHITICACIYKSVYSDISKFKTCAWCLQCMSPSPQQVSGKCLCLGFALCLADMRAQVYKTCVVLPWIHSRCQAIFVLVQVEFALCFNTQRLFLQAVFHKMSSITWCGCISRVSCSWQVLEYLFARKHHGNIHVYTCIWILISHMVWECGSILYHCADTRAQKATHMFEYLVNLSTYIPTYTNNQSHGIGVWIMLT